jgi:hypothetical protein
VVVVDVEHAARLIDEIEGVRPVYGALVTASALVFVEGTDSQTDMPPRYSRAPRAQRAYSAAPRNNGKNTTLIATLTAHVWNPLSDAAIRSAIRRWGCGW